MFLFGVTIQDFLYGVTVFMSVAVMPGFLSPFVAITMALVVVISSKKMRAQFPKNYFKHLVWSLGLWNSELRDNPFFISKARFVVLGP